MTWFKAKRVDWSHLAAVLLPYLVIIGVTYLMIFIQLKFRATFITGDRFLHFERFYDTSMQIRTGNYSYFQTNYGFNQSGRIFNALYGPLFAYLNGLVLILCHTWFRYQILVDFVVYLVGGMGMYHLGLKAKVNKLIALLIAVLYLQFGIILGILRANNFMAWGAALAPYVLMQAINMVQDHERPIHWLPLASIMSLVAQIHLLSAVFLAFTLIPFAIYGLVAAPHKRQMVIDFLKAIGTALVLTANIWGAFLVVYPGNKISLPNRFHLAAHYLGVGKVTFAHGSMASFVLVLLVIATLYLIFHWHDSALADLATVVGWFIFAISSRFMPWDHIQAHFPTLGSALQFPYRLCIGAIPLMLMVLGMVMTSWWQQKQQVVKAYIIFALLLAILQPFAGNARTMSIYAGKYNNRHHVVTMRNHYKLPPKKERWKIQWVTRNTNDGELFALVNRAEPDYLPVRPTADNLLYRAKVLDQEKRYPRKIVGSRMYLIWHAKKAKKRRLPIVIYHRSQLIMNGKQMPQSKLHLNRISNPLVHAKKGRNVAVLHYQTPVWFWFLLAAALIGWLFFFVYGIRIWVKKWHERN